MLAAAGRTGEDRWTAGARAGSRSTATMGTAPTLEVEDVVARFRCRRRHLRHPVRLRPSTARGRSGELRSMRRPGPHAALREQPAPTALPRSSTASRALRLAPRSGRRGHADRPSCVRRQRDLPRADRFGPRRHLALVGGRVRGVRGPSRTRCAGRSTRLAAPPCRTTSSWIAHWSTPRHVRLSERRRARVARRPRSGPGRRRSRGCPSPRWWCRRRGPWSATARRVASGPRRPAPTRAAACGSR